MRASRIPIVLCSLLGLLFINGCKKFPATLYVDSSFAIVGTKVHEGQHLYWDARNTKEHFVVIVTPGLCDEKGSLRSVNGVATCTVADQNFSSLEKKRLIPHHYTYHLEADPSTVSDRRGPGISSDVTIRRFAEFNTDFDIDVEPCKWCD